MVFAVALRLGLTSFGGPIAHLGYFRSEYVVRRRWLDEATYAEIVALCQSLPGPTSSEVGIAIGLLRAGVPGAFLSWLGFTLPSALAMGLFALTVNRLSVDAGGWIHGLGTVAVAVVALAAWGMARALAWDARRGPLAGAAAILALAWPTNVTQLVLILLAAVAGRLLLRAPAQIGTAPLRAPIGARVSRACAALFVGLLLLLPLARAAIPVRGVAVFDSFYRSGALVFGGGHVVLPLLHAEVVPPGWVSEEDFLAGYGAAQAAPGPLFTFAAYLGAVMRPGQRDPRRIEFWPEPNHAVGAMIASARSSSRRSSSYSRRCHRGAPFAHAPTLRRRCGA